MCPPLFASFGIPQSRSFGQVVFAVTLPLLAASINSRSRYRFATVRGVQRLSVENDRDGQALFRRRAQLVGLT
jgi:hypothetical protein